MEDFLAEFSPYSDEIDQINDDNQVKHRVKCDRCKRPMSVCLCSHLPSVPITLKKSKLIIIQHKNEQKRPLNTVALIKASLNADDCTVYRGNHFSEANYPELHKVLHLENTFLLYPMEGARDAADVKELGFASYNFVILDGTWKQAQGMYAKNKFLRNVPKMIIKPKAISEYVIRTQPTDECISTIECAALALSYIEGEEVKEVLLRPLRQLCSIQMKNGAVKHESKEAVKAKEEGSS